MILFILGCFFSEPSARDTQFCEDRCEDRCKVAGATLRRGPFDGENVYPTTRTDVINGDIRCSCYYPKGDIAPQ